MIVLAPIMAIGGLSKAIAKNPSMTWIIAASVLCLFVLMGILFSVGLPKMKRMQSLVDKLNLVTRENPVSYTHLDVYKRQEELYELGCANGADICIFGHTHCHEIEWRGNMVLMNPGSPSQPRGSRPSCMRMVLSEGVPAEIQLLTL